MTPSIDYQRVELQKRHIGLHLTENRRRRRPVVCSRPETFATFSTKSWLNDSTSISLPELAGTRPRPSKASIDLESFSTIWLPVYRRQRAKHSIDRTGVFEVMRGVWFSKFSTSQLFPNSCTTGVVDTVLPNTSKLSVDSPYICPLEFRSTGGLNHTICGLSC